MDYIVNYDRTDPISIECFAKRLAGHTFQEVVAAYARGTVDGYSDKKRKGGLGNLLEEVYFGYKANSNSAADFHEAGVELKVTPFEKDTKGNLRAGERLVLTMISYERPIEPDFDTSHLWEKCKNLLLIYYWRNRAMESNLLYRIEYVTLFTPTESDMVIIRQDYAFITGKIAAGKAHELSEGDTMYLGACTKGATAEKSIARQFYPPHFPAKKRAFCYKNSYMTYVLNQYIVKKAVAENIVQNAAQLENLTFEQLLESRVQKYIGITDRQLCKMFGIEFKENSKSNWITLAFRMLGIKSNHAAEFEKANITVKAIRIGENGSLVESSPFPTFDFKELAKEEVWEESQLYEYLSTERFLWTVFRKSGKNCIFKGIQLWNFPAHDMPEAERIWHKAAETTRQGIQLHYDGKSVSNNLPGMSESPIVHIRPHASKSYYRFDGVCIGDNPTYGSELPDGRWMTKQCFWLGHNYVLSQIKGYLKNE